MFPLTRLLQSAYQIPEPGKMVVVFQSDHESDSDSDWDSDVEWDELEENDALLEKAAFLLQEVDKQKKEALEKLRESESQRKEIEKRAQEATEKLKQCESTKTQLLKRLSLSRTKRVHPYLFRKAASKIAEKSRADRNHASGKMIHPQSDVKLETPSKPLESSGLDSTSDGKIVCNGDMCWRIKP